MGRIRARATKNQAKEDRERALARAGAAYRAGQYSSIRHAAEAYGLSHNTLWRRLNGAESNAKAREKHQSLNAAQERAVIRWITRLEEFGFPPRITHLKEAIALLKTGDSHSTNAVGKNFITRFLNRHPELVAKFTNSLDKTRVKMNNPDIIKKHFAHLKQVQMKYGISEVDMYNMDEKGFLLGKSDRAKVICIRRPRGMTGKMTVGDKNRELVTVVETVSGDGEVLPPLVIFKGQAHLMGWYQHLDAEACKGWKFTHTDSGWNNRTLSMHWLEHFDKVTKGRLSSDTAYRMLIIDGCKIHIHIDFIEYCMEARIVAYCLPPNATHLLQPLDVGLYSPLQKYYGEQVDDLVRFGGVAVRKGNFLPMLVKARQKTFTKDNIFGAWRGSGIIPHNPRIVLAKLPNWKDPAMTHKQKSPLRVRTPQKSSDYLRQARQVKLLMKEPTANEVKLLELLESMQKFTIGVVADLQLQQDLNRKFREAEKLRAPSDRRELKTVQTGAPLDAAVLKELYEQRERQDIARRARGRGRGRGRGQGRGTGAGARTADHVPRGQGRGRGRGKRSVHWEDEQSIECSEINLVELEGWNSEKSDSESSCSLEVLEEDSRAQTPPSPSPTPAPRRGRRGGESRGSRGTQKSVSGSSGQRGRKSRASCT